MGLGTGDDDALDGGDDPRLLEHVDDQRLAAEQQELFREWAPDALADPAGEHDHPDLHAVLRVHLGRARRVRGSGRCRGESTAPNRPEDRTGYHPRLAGGPRPSRESAGGGLDGRPRPGSPRSRSVSIRWERVQLVVDARLAPGARHRPAAGLALRRARGADDVAPTRASIDGDRAAAPVQRHAGTRPAAARAGPLARSWPEPTRRQPPGPSASPSRAAVDPARDAHAFPLRRRASTASTRCRAPDPARPLALDVELRLRHRDSTAMPARRIRARTGLARSLRAARGAVFRLFVQRAEGRPAAGPPGASCSPRTRRPG